MKLKNILEQVIKKIPISAIENLQRRIMFDNISLDELVGKVYKIKMGSLETSEKYSPNAPVQIYDSNKGIDHVLYKLLLRGLTKTNIRAEIMQATTKLVMTFNLDNFKLIRFRYMNYEYDYFTIEKK